MAQDAPTDGPPWLVALGILATRAGTTAPVWLPAVTRRARGGATIGETQEAEGPVTPRQDAALQLVERMIADLQEAADGLRVELAASTSREQHLTHERNEALRERDRLVIENEQLRYRAGEGTRVRPPQKPMD